MAEIFFTLNNAFSVLEGCEMEKFYTYKNATVYITPPTEEQLENIYKATELYLTRLVKDGYFDGNNNTSRNLSKK